MCSGSEYWPLESDEEDDEELDDEEIEILLQANYEDGVKGQNIIEPDDLADLICVDEGRFDLGQPP